MGSGEVAIVALSTMISLKVTFSDGLGGGKSTCRNASAVCVALSPQSASASSTSRIIRVWHEPTCVPDNAF